MKPYTPAEAYGAIGEMWASARNYFTFTAGFQVRDFFRALMLAARWATVFPVPLGLSSRPKEMKIDESVVSATTTIDFHNKKKEKTGALLSSQPIIRRFRVKFWNSMIFVKFVGQRNVVQV